MAISTAAALMRRSTMLLATGAFAVAARGRARAAEPVRIGISASEESSVLFMAQERGLFKDAGLDVALTVFPTNQLMQGLLAGALELGISNTGAIVLAHVRGLPLYLLAPAAVFSARQPISHIAVVPGSPIRSAKDLAGKTVGMLAVRDMAQAALLAWVDANGGDSKAVHFTEVPPLAQAAALQAGRLDAAVMNEPHFSNAKGLVRGLGLTYSNVSGGKPFQTTGIIANKSWADANPALVRRFAAVIHQSAQWANRNPDEAAVLISKLMKIDLDVLKTLPRVQWGEASSPALVQPVIDVMAKYAILPQRFPAQEVFAPGVE